MASQCKGIKVLKENRVMMHCIVSWICPQEDFQIIIKVTSRGSRQRSHDGNRTSKALQMIHSFSLGQFISEEWIRWCSHREMML